MARFSYLICFLLLIASCAQVGSITGGEKDQNPPRVKKTTLESGTTNFQGKEVSIVFDEFVLLNKPTENIFLVPADAKVEAKLQKKTLVLNWKEDLLANTTYTLYLNAAVEDVTEGNDSLMQITFSTGAKIDTLKCNVSVKDAFKNEPKGKVVVGLFDSLTAEKPRYFAQTKPDGLIQLTSLKQGEYFLKAFEDKNSDLIIQKDESQDILFKGILIDTSFKDTLKLRISTPNALDKIKNYQVLGPGIIATHIPADVVYEKVKLNGLETRNYFYTKPDSLVISIGNIPENTIQLELDRDTVLLTYAQKEKQKPLKAKFIELENGSSTFLKFRYADFVTSIDNSKISILNLKDSSNVLFEVSAPFFDEVQLQLLDEKAKQLSVSFADSSVLFATGKYNAKEKTAISLKEKRELGSLKVKVPNLYTSAILQLLQKGKVMEEKSLNGDVFSVQFLNLLPGEYDFRIIVDSNRDGVWSPIDIDNHYLAEEVIYFSTHVKVRANWEVETELKINSEEK